MLKLTKTLSTLMLIVCVIFSIQLFGCSEDSEDSESDVSEAPPLPPDESMIVDLSAFGIEEAETGPEANTSAPGKNYANAVARAVIINTSVAAASAGPTKLFRMAKNSVPVEQEDGSWLWSYSMKYGLYTLEAKLTGIVKGKKTDWSMKVSNDSPNFTLKDFEWFTGTSTEGNSTGSWQFFDLDTPEEHNSTVKVDWVVQLVLMKADLSFENNDTHSEYLGDVLTYNVADKIVTMTYKDDSENETWDITLDAQTGAGSLKVKKYNGGERACWDAQKQDVNCN